MDNSKLGGADSDSGSNVLPHQKRDTLLTLQQAKEYALESKRKMLAIRTPDCNLVVSLNSSVKAGTPRVLNDAEIEALRATKHLIADSIGVFLEQSDD